MDSAQALSTALQNSAVGRIVGVGDFAAHVAENLPKGVSEFYGNRARTAPSSSLNLHLRPKWRTAIVSNPRQAQQGQKSIPSIEECRRCSFE